MSYNIVNTPQVAKEIKKLLKKYPKFKTELVELKKSLERNPFQGTSLGNNIYKIRLSIKSKHAGKRGGARVITFVEVTESQIVLVSIYDKSNQETITIKEINERIKKFYS
jgi:mRNA-degrading endonuclease RelE of RelBE toxin-antitoxin system